MIQFPKQSFWTSLARFFDLFGVLGPTYVPETDEEALRRDWEAVMGDMETVLAHEENNKGR